MNIQEFIGFHNLKIADSEIFNSPEAKEFASVEKTVTEAEITIVEKIIDCRLPQNYKDFCKQYGGGYFGYTLILSLDQEGEWFIKETIKEFSHFIPTGFIPFADDQTGGFYCFKLQNGEAIEEIYYLDSSGLISKTNYSDFLNFVISLAYDS
jgi:SMI1 / KNR4 family (SUKH-1)